MKPLTRGLVRVAAMSGAVSGALCITTAAARPAHAVPAAAPMIPFAPTDAFAPVDCAEFGAAADIAPEDAVCGDVTVPLRHADPRGPTITLAVAVVKRGGAGGGEAGDASGTAKSTVAQVAPAAAAAPLILLQGGPGGSTIDAFLDLALAPEGDRAGLAGIRRQRDLVLLDQRGTRYGRPALMCPELVELTRKTIELDLDPDVYFALEDDATADCRDRLEEEGVDVAPFNSLENAADIPAVAAALGYAHYSVYGVSYGSLLALHLMRAEPIGLESVVLDGVVPPPIDFNVQAPASLDRSLGLLFEACAAAPDCKAAYPNLEASLRDTLDRLDRRPARVPVVDPASGIRYRALVDGRTLLDAVHQLLYGGPALPIVPRVIAATARGDDGALGEIMGTYAFDDSLAEGMYLSTVCGEDGDIDPDAVPLDRIRPWLADRLSGDAEDLLAACDIWDVPALPAPIDAPVTSDVPTLLLSGRFDPITPPPFAEDAARTLHHAQSVVFPTGGHGALGDPCPNALVAAFLAQPTAPLDTACAAEPAAPDFRTPADTFFSPIPRAMLDLLVPLTSVDVADQSGVDGEAPGDGRADALPSGTPSADDPAADGARGADADAEAAADIGSERTLDGGDPPVSSDLARVWAPVGLAAAAWLILVLGAGLWALGRAFGAAREPRRPARAVPALAVVAAGAMPAFGVGFSVLLWRLIEDGRDMILYVGVPMAWTALVWLPAIGAAAGLALAAVAVWAWRVRAFGIRRRLLVTVLGLAGAAQAAAVAWLGLGWPWG